MCPAIIITPRLFMADCKISEPEETIATIKPIENPWANNDLYNSQSNPKCLGLNTRILDFFKMYNKHKTAEID